MSFLVLQKTVYQICLGMLCEPANIKGITATLYTRFAHPPSMIAFHQFQSETLLVVELSSTCPAL